MNLTANQRKALFVAKAVEDGLTFEKAAEMHAKCGWPHLKAGLLGKRVLSNEVKANVAAYVGRPVRKLFPAERAQAATV